MNSALQSCGPVRPFDWGNKITRGRLAAKSGLTGMNREIKAFLAVVDEGSVTGAVRRLHIEQPAVTKTLQRLEAEVGAQLFERSSRGLSLTRAGEAFYVHCKRIETEYQCALESVDAITRNHLDVLRIGAGPLFHLMFVPNVLADLAKEFPETQVRVEVGQATRVVPMLQAHELDLALGRLDDSDMDATLEQIPLADVPTGIVLAESHPMASRSSIVSDLDPFLDQRWVVYQDDPKPLENLRAFYRKHGVSEPSVSVVTSSFATGLQLVATGDYLMSGPIPLAPYYKKFGLSVLQTREPIAVTSSGAWVRRSSLEYPIISRFLELMKAQVQR